jgi:hypothetical protein
MTREGVRRKERKDFWIPRSSRGMTGVAVWAGMEDGIDDSGWSLSRAISRTGMTEEVDFGFGIPPNVFRLTPHVF